MSKSHGLLGVLSAFRVLFVCVGFFRVAAFAQARDEEPPKQAGVDVPAPKRTKTVAPVYPAEAQAQGLRGIVILELILDTSGRVASAEVVRSIPPFDEAALTAVRKWEYEVTKLDGKPVRVKMTVPISFALRLPETTRQEGIPELRQGAAPAYPPGAQGSGSVTAQLTLDAEGRVAEAEAKTGGPPWDEALLRALRTWRFAVQPGRGVLSFRVQADFVPAAEGQPARVTLAMSGLQESESFGSGSERSASAAPPSPAPSAAAPQSEPAPKPAPEAEKPASGAGVTAPGTEETPPAEHDPAALAPPKPPEPGTAANQTAAPPPPVEVITVPQPVPTSPAVAGASSLGNVSVGPGVPDLVKGRRPVPPPLARMTGTLGTVEVRFSLDAGGQTAVKSSSGQELLQTAAEDAVRTWSFRRTTAERLHLLAVFDYRADSASASVTLEP